MRIKGGVPFQGISRFIPKFDPFEELTETRDKNVEKIRILFRFARWRTLARRDSETRWGEMKTGQEVYFAGQSRQQPFVPFLPSWRVPIGPGNSHSQFVNPDPFQICEQLFN